jgi:hypothetical protein
VDTSVIDTSKPFNWDEATFGASTTPTLPAPAIDNGDTTFTDSAACEDSTGNTNCL